MAKNSSCSGMRILLFYLIEDAKHPVGKKTINSISSINSNPITDTHRTKQPQTAGVFFPHFLEGGNNETLYWPDG